MGYYRWSIQTFLIVFGAVLLIVGATTYVRASHKNASATAFKRSGTETTAQVVDFITQPDCYDHSSGETSCWDVVYSLTYQVNGVQKNARVEDYSVDNGLPQPQRPSTVAIYYENANPSTAEIASQLSGSAIFDDSYWLLGPGVLLIVAGIALQIVRTSLQAV